MVTRLNLDFVKPSVKQLLQDLTASYLLTPLGVKYFMLRDYYIKWESPSVISRRYGIRKRTLTATLNKIASYRLLHNEIAYIIRRVEPVLTQLKPIAKLSDGGIKCGLCGAVFGGKFYIPTLHLKYQHKDLFDALMNAELRALNLK